MPCKKLYQPGGKEKLKISTMNLKIGGIESGKYKFPLEY